MENGVIAVGAFGNGTQTGQVRLFRQEGSAWVTQQTFSHGSGESDNRYGFGVSLSNGLLLVGAFGADAGPLVNAGQAYVYGITDPDAVVPELTINRSGGNAVLTWTPAPGWTLWRSPSLAPGSWTQVTVATDGTHSHPVSSAPRMFFRLQK